MFKIEKSMGFSPQVISGFIARNPRKRRKPKAKTASLCQRARRWLDRKRAISPRRRKYAAAPAAARIAAERNAAPRPFGTPPFETDSVRTYVATAMPTRRARPKPRSESLENRNQQIGKAAAPSAVMAKYQRRAAGIDPISESDIAGAADFAARRSGSTGGATRRRERGAFSQSHIVGGGVGIAAIRIRRVRRLE